MDFPFPSFMSVYLFLTLINLNFLFFGWLIGFDGFAWCEERHEMSELIKIPPNCWGTIRNFPFRKHGILTTRISNFTSEAGLQCHQGDRFMNSALLLFKRIFHFRALLRLSSTTFWQEIFSVIRTCFIFIYLGDKEAFYVNKWSPHLVLKLSSI